MNSKNIHNSYKAVPMGYDLKEFLGNWVKKLISI